MRIVKAGLFSLITLLAVSSAFAAPARRVVTKEHKLAMFAKPAVVRIIDGYKGTYYLDLTKRTYEVPYISLGSGVMIDSKGYIATNAHVVSTAHDGDEKAKEVLVREYLGMVAQEAQRDPASLSQKEVENILANTQLQGLQPIRVVITPDGSSYPFEIKSYGAPTGLGKDVAIVKIEVRSAPILKLGDSDKVQLQDHVTVLGYPGAADTFSTGLLDDRSSLEASVTDGKISARKKMADGSPVLQISAPATHGNSGGPVLNDDGDVIGLLTFGGDTVRGQEIQGFTFMVASNTVTEFVKQAGANNELGIVDQRYREGLEKLWNGEYTAAMALFEEVRRLYPQHSEVEGLIREAQQEISSGGERRRMEPWMWMAAAAVGAVILLGLLFLMIRKLSQPKAVLAAPRAAVESAPLQSAPTGGYARPPLADRTVLVGRYGSLRCISGPMAGRDFEIGDAGVSIGRDSGQSEIVIEDGRISKRHVWIGPKNGRVVVTDQNSTNGTFLNDPSSRIGESVLKEGDTIIVSNDVARFRYQQ